MRLLTQLLVLAALSSFACADSPDEASSETPIKVDLEAQAEAVQATIDAEVLREPIAHLASDELGGRLPGSEGDVAARQYMAEQLAALGLEPGGDHGGWEQTFTLEGEAAHPPSSWTFRTESDSLDLAFHDDFIAVSGGGYDVANVDDAELVFVGYGMSAPEEGWEDYATDVAGKVVVIMNNDPDWDDDLFAGNRRLYYGRWDYKYINAAAHGAVGAIIIHTTPSAGYGWNVIQTSWTGEQFKLPTDEHRMPLEGWTTEEATRQLFEMAGHDLDALRESAKSPEFEPVPLGVSTSISFPVDRREIQTANVIGRLPGRDPELASETLVYCAHHDHLGASTNEDGETVVYNGALDNAAGVSQLLAIARAFTALTDPPRRTVEFVFVGAEEQGLLGSEHYAANPTVPPGKIAAVINHDGANIWGRTRDVTFIGYEKSSLGQVVDRFAADQGRSVKPDQFPDRGFYYRSDQFNFARIGVPGIYLDVGTEFVDRPEGWGRETIEAWEGAHYHQPSDELVDSWSFEGMVEDARLSFRTGVHLAESDELPTWTPGDEFEAARQEALAALGGQ